MAVEDGRFQSNGKIWEAKSHARCEGEVSKQG